MNELKLCYVSGSMAYFSDKNPEDVWGDDWNDAPYEHNAGSPYDYNLMVMWGGPFDEPSSKYRYNSPYSVEQINRDGIPWLVTDEWCKERITIKPRTTLNKFIELVQKAGGEVYLPASGRLLADGTWQSQAERDQLNQVEYQRRLGE